MKLATVYHLNDRSLSKKATDLTETSLEANEKYIPDGQLYLELKNTQKELKKTQAMLVQIRTATASATQLYRPDIEENIQNTLLSPQIILINTLKSFWRLSDNEICILLGFDVEELDYVSELLTGQSLPRGKDIQDRILYLYDIRKSLRALFKDAEVENEWLREPSPALDNISPMDFMLSGKLSDILILRDHINTISGY